MADKKKNVKKETIKKDTKNKKNDKFKKIKVFFLAFFGNEKVDKLKSNLIEKKVMYSIALIVSFLIVFVVYVQFKTVEQTDIQVLEAMREVELRTEIASIKKKIEEKEEQIEKTNKKITEYLNELKNNSSAPELLDKELKQAEIYLGYTNVKGPGIIITLTDTIEFEITATDILMIVNQLKIAGAEAISINDERLVLTSEIVTVSNNLVYVNGRKQNNPYVIRAIGKSLELESAVTTKGGTLNEMKASNKNVSYRLSNDVEVAKYNRNIDLKYVK